VSFDVPLHRERRARPRLIEEKLVLKSPRIRTFAIITAIASAMGSGTMSAQNTSEAKYTVKVPGGLAFSEFKGYEAWQLISISHGDDIMAATLGNPAMIRAYEAGFPGNGKPIPDGAKMAKIHWVPKKSQAALGASVPSTLHDVDFMVKDSKRFKDSAGWGWGAFEYDTTTHAFTPATTAAKPPQSNDAKCGLGCHTIVAKRDYVFTDYQPR
jgi:Cytochrome P460